MDNIIYQSITAREPQTLNPLSANKFRVVFHRIPHIVYFCQAANLPGISINEYTQPTPFATPVRRPMGGLTYDNFDMSFALSEDMSNWKQLHDWLIKIPPTVNFSNRYEKYPDNYSDATLVVLNNSSKPFFAVHLKDCFPTSLGAIQFETNISDVTPLTCQVSFAYSGYYLENLTSS